MGAAGEGIGEGGVAPIYPSDGEGVLFSYKFVRTLLALTSKVSVGEVVAIEVLMYTTIWSIKDSEREKRQASIMDFIGGEARGGANGVVIGILWCSLQTMANVLSQSVVDTFYASISTGVIGARCELMYPE